MKNGTNGGISLLELLQWKIFGRLNISDLSKMVGLCILFFFAGFFSKQILYNSDKVDLKNQINTLEFQNKNLQLQLTAKIDDLRNESLKNTILSLRNDTLNNLLSSIKYHVKGDEVTSEFSTHIEDSKDFNVHNTKTSK